MTQQLRVLDAFLEDLGSVSSIHMLAHECVELQFQRTRHPLLASPGSRYPVQGTRYKVAH